MIRYLAFIVALTWSNWTFGQESSVSINETHLTSKEWRLLDSLLSSDNDHFSFETKKVAFISGHSATDLKNKDAFFKVLNFDYLDQGLHPNIEYRLFDERQKQASGGYDVLVMQTPKILTDAQLEMHIQTLGMLDK